MAGSQVTFLKWVWPRSVIKLRKRKRDGREQACTMVPKLCAKVPLRCHKKFISVAGDIYKFQGKHNDIYQTSWELLSQDSSVLTLHGVIFLLTTSYLCGTRFSIVAVIKSKCHMKINMVQKVRMVVSKYDSKNWDVVWHSRGHLRITQNIFAFNVCVFFQMVLNCFNKYKLSCLDLTT